MNQKAMALELAESEELGLNTADCEIKLTIAADGKNYKATFLSRSEVRVEKLKTVSWNILDLPVDCKKVIIKPTAMESAWAFLPGNGEPKSGSCDIHIQMKGFDGVPEEELEVAFGMSLIFSSSGMDSSDESESAVVLVNPPVLVIDKCGPPPDDTRCPQGHRHPSASRPGAGRGNRDRYREARRREA